MLSYFQKKLKAITQKLFHFSLSRNYFLLLKLAFKLGAKANYVNRDGVTPLYWAASHGNTEAVRALMREGKVDATVSVHGITPLHTAAEYAYEEIARLLIVEGQADANAVDEEDRTPLHYAARNGHAGLARVLIRDGKANVNAVNKSGNTPLHYAACYGHAETARVLIVDGRADVEAVNAYEGDEEQEKLIEEDDGEEMPLHYAARNGHTETVKVLIVEGKANIHARDGCAYLPLHKSVMSGNAETTRYLISRGAEVNCTDNYGDTPLHYAAHSGHIEAARALIEAKAIVNAVNADPGGGDPQLPYIYEDVAGNTPLHYAAERGHLEFVRFLITEAGVNPNGREVDDERPIVTAFEGGHHELVRLLAQHGAQLPEHLRREQQANLIIHNQNVHEMSVHLYVSEAATALYQRYRDKDTETARAALIAWVNGLTRPDEKTQTAKRCIESLQDVKFTDLRSGVSMRHALGLVWLGIHDPNAQTKEKLVFTEKDYADRREKLITSLYEIGRIYNIDAQGNDNQKQDEKSCPSGSFNVLITTLAGGHDDVKFLFVSKETIAEKAKVLLKEHFLALEANQKQAFAKEWTIEKGAPEALINRFKGEIQSSLHAQFDEFRSLVLDYDKTISEALEMLSFMNPPLAPKSANEAADSVPAVTHAYQLRARQPVTPNPRPAIQKPPRRRAQ